MFGLISYSLIMALIYRSKIGKIGVFLGLFGGIILCSQAQTTREKSAHKISLSESIKQALQSQVQMRNALLDERIQQLQINLYLSAMMPQIAYNVNTTYFTNIPKRFIPDFITPATVQILSQLGIKSGNGQIIKVPAYDPSKGFFTQMNTRWNISQDFAIQQILFDPDVFIAVASTRSLTKLSKLQTQAVKEEVILNTAKAYFTLVFLRKRLSVADTLLTYTQSIYREIQAISTQGFQDEDALIQMQLNLNRVQSLNSQLHQAYQIAERNFAYLIGLNIATEKMPQLDLSSDFSLQKLTQLPLMPANYTNKVEHKLLETTLKLRKLGVLQKKIAYIPRIGLFGNIGYINLSNDFQLTTFGSSKGFRNDFVGLKFSIGIFEGFKKRHELKIAQMEYVKAQNDLENSDKSLDLLSQNAQLQALTRLKDLQRAKENLDLSNRLYTRTLSKRQRGISSSVEILNARIRLAEYEDSYLGGFLDAIYSRLTWQKALGNLEDFISEIDK